LADELLLIAYLSRDNYFNVSAVEVFKTEASEAKIVIPSAMNKCGM